MDRPEAIGLLSRLLPAICSQQFFVAVSGVFRDMHVFAHREISFLYTYSLSPLPEPLRRRLWYEQDLQQRRTRIQTCQYQFPPESIHVTLLPCLLRSSPARLPVRK